METVHVAVGGGVSAEAAHTRAAQWGLDRVVSVSYGVVYDYIFEHFEPYQALQQRVVSLVERAAPAGADRTSIRVLDIGCGPGNFSISLASAGFTVLGTDPYSALIDLAREKRRTRGLSNLSFQQADVVNDPVLVDETFDHVINVHSLYVHPAPDALLRRACALLKPGGHGVFVNFTRRVPLRATYRAIARRHGIRTALRCLCWVLPNAVFEAARKPIGPHYWQEREFGDRLQSAGFVVRSMERAFFDNVSLLAWVQKEGRDEGRERSLSRRATRS